MVGIPGLHFRQVIIRPGAIEDLLHQGRGKSVLGKNFGNRLVFLENQSLSESSVDPEAAEPVVHAVPLLRGSTRLSIEAGTWQRSILESTTKTEGYEYYCGSRRVCGKEGSNVYTIKIPLAMFVREWNVLHTQLIFKTFFHVFRNESTNGAA